jgi:hypothetical protein
MANLRTAKRVFLDSSRIQIRTEFLVDPNFITVTGHTDFSPHFLSFSPDASELFLSAIAEPLHYAYPPPQYTAPFFSHYRAPYSLSSLLWAKPPHRSSLLHLPFQLISATTHSIIRMGSPKVVDLERVGLFVARRRARRLQPPRRQRQLPGDLFISDLLILGSWWLRRSMGMEVSWFAAGMG